MVAMSEAQKIYNDVARLEAALNQVMDNIPAVALSAGTGRHCARQQPCSNRR